MSGELRDPRWDPRFYPCDRCGAEPWQHCVSVTGRWTRPHVDRIYKADAVWLRDHTPT